MSFPLIYIYNFFVSLFLLLVCKIKQFPLKMYLYLMILYYLFVFGQRWTAGVDFPGYFRNYLIGFKAEYGYYVVQNFFYENNISFGALIFIIYFFTTITSLWFFKKFSKSDLGIFLFFLSEYHIMSLNPIRTYISINFFLVGLYLWEINNKKLCGFIIMSCGLLFHNLTLGVMIIYLLYKSINISKYRKILNYVLFIIPLINFKTLIFMGTKLILPKYSEYFGGMFDRSLSLLNIIRYYLILILFLILKKYLSSSVKKENLILNGTYIFFILMSVATHFAALHRIAYFFKIFELIFFVYILDYKEVKKILKVVIISLFILNYIGIIYKDMGTLENYELRRVHIFNVENREELFTELDRVFKLQGWVNN